jgi:hypothetical protein
LASGLRAPKKRNGHPARRSILGFVLSSAPDGNGRPPAWGLCYSSLDKYFNIIKLLWCGPPCQSRRHGDSDQSADRPAQAAKFGAHASVGEGHSFGSLTAFRHPALLVQDGH